MKANSEAWLKAQEKFIKVAVYLGDEGELAFAPIEGQKERTERWDRKVIEVYNPLEIIEGEVVGIDRGV